MVPQCLCYVVMLWRVSLISSSSILMLGRFGIFGGGCGIFPIGIFLHGLSLWISGVGPLIYSSFLQVAWALGPLFIIWNLWLERNHWIFQDVQLVSPHLWWKILHSLGETIAAKCYMTESIDPCDVKCFISLHLPPLQQ